MSKKLDKADSFGLVKQLEALGLSEKESNVYLALLPLSSVGASALIRATGLHGQFVYDALHKLEVLGLAQHVVQRGRRKFSAGSPERLLALVEEKKLMATGLVRQLRQHFVGQSEQSFEVLQGQGAFIAHEFALLEELPEEAEIAVLGGGGDQYIQHMGHEVDAYERIRVHKKISLRYISTGGNANYLKIMAQNRPFFEYRVLPSPMPGIDADIFSDRIVFRLFGDPVVSFVFKNKKIAEGYKGFFDALWNLSSV